MEVDLLHLALILKVEDMSLCIDSLSVNNLLSFTDNEIKNKNLYSKILITESNFNDNNINFNVIDARDYNLISKI